MAEKIVASGFAIFALIVLTAYTAMSASFMINASQYGEYKNLDAVVESRGEICILSAVSDQFRSTYPETSDLLAVKEDAANMFKDMDSTSSKSCVASILDLDGFKKTLIDNEDNCDKMKTGNVLLTIGNAFPINSSFRDNIAYVIDDGVINGDYTQSKENSQSAFLIAPKCSVGSENYDPDQPVMNLDQLAAPLVITFLCTTIGGLFMLHKRHTATLHFDDKYSKQAHFANTLR